MAKNCVLIVDDDEINRSILVELFEEQYQIIEAENGEIGLELLRKNKDKICAVLLDNIMPVMDGLTFLRKADEERLQAEIPVFVVSADQRTPSLMEAYRLGVMDVIAKPVVPYVITRRVNSVIELFDARKQLSSEVREQREKLLVQQQQIIELGSGMMDALFAAIEGRSGETGGHVRRIRRLTEILLTETELGAASSQEEILAISMASMLHDIGKISIADAVLNKPGRFNEEERRIMQTHTTLGVEILKKIPQMKTQGIYKYACDIILHHHERWDGRGYPEGLKGDEISTAAQVVSIADVYEALLSKRVYKDAYSREKAIRMITAGECGVFNPKLLEAFLSCEPALYESLFQEETAGIHCYAAGS